jgi:3-methyladenine DNA glycosylase/8-oxoguanine DNA glycosylase
MNEERRLARARTFDEIAELYDRARIEHPDQLIEELFAVAGIEPKTADVLERRSSRADFSMTCKLSAIFPPGN